MKKKLLHNVIKRCVSGIAVISLLVTSGLVVPVSTQAAVKWSQVDENDLYPGARYGCDEDNYAYVLPQNVKKQKGGICREKKLGTILVILCHTFLHSLHTCLHFGHS